ncbi:hypothetical protein GE21DRAFT_1016824 [Neurospora crassa]|nr:hypothetical protein GE21DRAFT_1016824 [Neurospora crassa]
MSTSWARKRTLSPAAMSRQYSRAVLSSAIGMPLEEPGLPGQWASTAVPRSSTLRSQIFALIRTRPVLLAPIKIPKLSKKASAIQDPASLACVDIGCSKTKRGKNSLRVEQVNSEVSTLPADAKLHLRLIDTQYCGSKGGGRNSTDSRWPRKRHMSPTPRTAESTRQVTIETPPHCHSRDRQSSLMLGGPTRYPGLQLFALLPLLAGGMFKTCSR